MKILILTLFFLTVFKGFSQQKDSLAATKPREINNVTHDSAKVALDIVVDSSGKLINATYVADISTTNNEKMIEIAKRKANQLKYPARKKQYTQRLIFNFNIVQ